jgi:hypothetical protein
MPKPALSALALCLAACLASVTAAGAQGLVRWADGGGPYLGVDAFVGTPSAIKDVFRQAFPGLSLRYIASPNFELSLDYAFMETEYYYPSTPSGPWVGPVEWSSMPAAFSGMKSDWIFFQTRHYIAPQAWYLAPLESYGLPLAIRLGAGPALSFVIPSESAKYYPGLSDAYDLFTKSFKAYLGLSLRAGLEYRPWPFARFGLDYLFVVDDLAGMAGELSKDPAGYFNRSGNFIIYAGARL